MIAGLITMVALPPPSDDVLAVTKNDCRTPVLKPMLKDMGSFLLANQAALYALDNFISPNNGCTQNGAAENKP